MPLFVKAPGKLVIFGEYAVLHGGPAVVTSVDRGLRVQITPRNQGSHLTMPHLGLSAVPIAKLRDEGVPAVEAVSPNTGGQVQAVLDIIDCFEERVHYGHATPPLVDIAIDARELYREGVKLGLGSSAALTVALLAGLQAHASGRRPKREPLFQLAFQVHRHLQGGRGSGIDVAASVFGGYCLYRLPDSGRVKTPGVSALDWPASVYTLAVWSGRPASTAGLLGELERYRARAADRYQSLMDTMIEVARKGVGALIDGDARGFMAAVDRHFQWLKALTAHSRVGIVTDDDLRLAAIADDCGAVYKPSGAGGGDVGLVFADALERLEQTRHAISEAGYQILNLTWGAPGVTL